MNVRSILGVFLAGACIAGVLTFEPSPAGAQWITYSAKFVCGREDDAGDSVVQGKYRTVVNIHNPHNLVDVIPAKIEGGGFPIPVCFYKKVVLALPQDEPRQPPTCRQFECLDHDFAVAVDCADISRKLAADGIPAPAAKEGFVVIEVLPGQGMFGDTPELDVTAVYTVRHRPAEEPDVESIDVETIIPLAVIGQPNGPICAPD